jgi:hypothetical protein
MVNIPPIILKRFAQFEDCKCWGFCNNSKIPVQLKNPERHTSWKNNPDLGVVTLSDLLQFSPMHVGFGIFTSRNFGIGCLDFDHFLKNGEPDFNNKIDQFLNIQDANTFAEVSSSGNGVHAFYFFNQNNSKVREFPISLKKFGMNFTVSELDKLDKNAPSGKFYCNDHFIKLTGRIYKDNDNLIRFLDNEGYSSFERAVTTTYRPKKSTHQSIIPLGKPWADILSEGGLMHVELPEYVGKLSPRSRKLCIECWKIECPNVNNHKTRRPGDISADMAILSKYADGSSSLTCNHHACDPSGHPNLLQKLWDKINNKVN